MQKFLITGAIVIALAAPAFAADTMSGPAQTGSGGMAGGMAHTDGMAHDDMGKTKPKKKTAMKHDSMSGGSMSGPAQTGGGMANGGMSGPTH